MDFGILVPIAAIVVWGGSSALKRYISYRESVDLRVQQQQPAQSQDIVHELEVLRREVAELRDTSTRYDLSIDHHLRELDMRLQSVERRGTSISPSQSAAPDVQQINNNA